MRKNDAKIMRKIYTTKFIREFFREIVSKACGLVLTNRRETDPNCGGRLFENDVPPPFRLWDDSGNLGSLDVQEWCYIRQI